MEPFVTVQHSQHAAPVFGILLIMFGFLILLIITALLTMAFCKIFSRAGYCWAFGLLMLLPVVGAIITPFILAFSDWPIQKELRKLKQQEEKPQT